MTRLRSERKTEMGPTFFATRAELRAWLERHHATADELLVGYYKRGSGKPSLTWPESVEEALCFGWIDGVRKGLDEERYQIRFTPRQPGSIWSAVNLRKAQELIDLGRMRPAGLAAFEARRVDRSAVYAYEQADAATLDEAYERELKANAEAWAYLESCPPSYRRAAVHWVMSAKQLETRRRRLRTLIDDSAQGRTGAAAHTASAGEVVGGRTADCSRTPSASRQAPGHGRPGRHSLGPGMGSRSGSPTSSLHRAGRTVRAAPSIAVRLSIAAVASTAIVTAPGDIDVVGWDRVRRRVESAGHA